MNPTILVVEDESCVADVTCRALERHSMRTIRARTFSEAVRFLDASPDGIVLDIGLPDGSGLDLLANLQANPATCVVVTTGMGDHYIMPALQLGAHEFLPKPYDAHALSLRMLSLLRLGACPSNG